MNTRLDDLEKELMELDSTEQRLEKLKPSISKSRHYLQDKLAILERLELKYGSKVPGNGGMERHVIRERRKEAERSLYPNIAVRLIYRLTKKIKSSGQTFAYEKYLQNNIKQLSQEVNEKGFRINIKGLEQMIRQGNREFVFPVSYYINQEERMDFNLKFSRDASGNYEQRECQARYRKLNDEHEVRTCIFQEGSNMDVNAHQMYNLLAGRAIRTSDGNTGKHWIQLDFTDKDASGNFLTKSFPNSYGFDLFKGIKELDMDEGLDFLSKLRLLEQLENGDRVEMVRNDKTIEVEANPLRKTLNVYEAGKLKLENETKPTAKQAISQTERPQMKLVKGNRVKGLSR